MNIAEAVERFDAKPSGTGFMAKCPAHDDHTPSLRIGGGDDGRVLLYCHAGCTTEAICQASGITPADLFLAKPERRARETVATYGYRKADGSLAYEVVRYAPKDFRQRRPDGNGGHVWNLKGVDRVLYRLPELKKAIAAGSSVFVVEGEKDVETLRNHGFVATCNSGGTGKWDKSYTEIFQNVDVVIIADKDTAGRKHAAGVENSLKDCAKSVRTVELPDVSGKPVKDATDFFAAGGDSDRLRQIVEAAPVRIPERSEPPKTFKRKEFQAFLKDSRPKVQLPGDDHLLSDCAAEIGQILSSKDIFFRGGLPFVLNDRNDGLSFVTAHVFRTWAEDHLVCYRTRNIGNSGSIQIDRTMSEAEAKGILAAPQFLNKLRPIERVNPVRLPVMRLNGQIELLREGYDVETKSYTLNAAFIASGMSDNEAVAVIDKLLSEFKFADSGRSKSVAVAAIFTVFGVGLLPWKSLRPCFIFLANAEGAGKTLLVKCATVPVLGYAPTGTRPKDEDEMRKALHTAVMEAKSIVFFDNAKKHLDSEALEGFITSQDYEGRILGESKSFRGENHAVVFITGNGCTVSPDMRRRSLFCELLLEVERAEDRVFEHNLEVPELLERRGLLLSALWSLIQAWDKANRPEPTRGNSSFPEWANIIGGIVEHAGYGCPLETPQIEAAADTNGTDMRSLITSIADGAQLKVVKFDETLKAAQDGGLFSWILPDDGGEIDRRAKAVFAGILKRYDRRIVGDYRFTVLEKGRNRRFQLEKIV